MMNLKKLRKSRHMTQRELSKIVGASDASLSMYENGKQQPDLEMLVKIADALCVSVDELLNHNQDAVKQDEAWDFREQMRNNPTYRMLFSAAKTARPEHLRAAVAMLKSLEGENEEDETDEC